MSSGPTHPSAGGSMMQGTADSPSIGAFRESESARPTLVGDRHMVSAGHPLVAQVGLSVFEAGGNAVDAGVAAGLAANVVEVCMCSFGGVAPILVRTGATHSVTAIDGIGGWGRGATLERFRERYGDTMPLGGAIAIVPGAPGAWIAALRAFGTWSFRDVAAPAIELATRGFVLDRRLADQQSVLAPTLAQWPSTTEVFILGGRPYAAGERLRQPALGRLLTRLSEADSGPTRDEALANVHRAFYEGDVAESIVSFVKDDGGWLELDDLAEHRPELAAATSTVHGNYTVHITGPWSQGPALLQALNVLRHSDLDTEHNSAAYISTVAKALRSAFSDRERYYGDPRHIDVPLERLLSDEHARQLAEETSQPAADTPDGEKVNKLDTTCLCTADADGNVFSATMSDALDGGPLHPDLGILVSPRGLQSWLDPDHPSALGPGRRPRLTPSPCIYERGGESPAAWAIGSPGGDVSLQAMLQIFLNTTQFQMTPQQAVEAPRFAIYDAPNSFFPHTRYESLLQIESRIPEATRRAMAEAGYNVDTLNAYDFDAGSVSITGVERSAGGETLLSAGADPRRIAYAVGR
jgi:gamma-glutamyltranspeptidase/glutathione hydrolase